MENLINTLFPPKCVFCGSIGDVFCENCISNCAILLNQHCIVCGRPAIDGRTHRYCLKTGVPTQSLSVYVYGKNVRECIRKSKYSSRLFMCLRRLSFEGTAVASEWGYDFKDFIVVSIPVSKNREKLRGFNQADIISRSFAKRFKLPIDNSILSRIKDTKAQHSSTRKERFQNISGSFFTPLSANSTNSNAKGKKILLVDDICTTGATFLEAARVLYKNWAIEVRCFSLSKKL